MPRIIFLPHEQRCPDGAVVEAEQGDALIELALDNGIQIEHACEMACANQSNIRFFFWACFII